MPWKFPNRRKSRERGWRPVILDWPPSNLPGRLLAVGFGHPVPRRADGTEPRPLRPFLLTGSLNSPERAPDRQVVDDF